MAPQPTQMTEDTPGFRQPRRMRGFERFTARKRSGNRASVPSADVDVVLLRWPVEEARREEARRTGLPRLLLVEDGAPPPLSSDELEDWIRVPAVDLDLRARVEGLRRRAEARVAPVPELDDDGVLRLGGRWVSMPPVEARLTEALLDRYGAVVSREALAKAGWPTGAPGRNALDVHVLRLRRRLSPIELAIRTVRSRGYLLERVDDYAGRADAGSGPGQAASGS
jgi:DNA-binding winged helix-turn-helix (wHTH) protein